MRKMKLPKIVGNLLDSHLEIFSLPQGIENSRQFLLLRTDSFQKTVVGCLTLRAEATFPRYELACEKCRWVLFLLPFH